MYMNVIKYIFIFLVTGVSVTRKLNSNKIDWMIEKYGKNTFNFQPKTRKAFLDAVSKKYQELFKDFKA